MTTDMSSAIIPKSDQTNADDLISGPMTVTIASVKIRPGTEQPISIHYEGDNGKPYKPCKSMARVMVAMWGADASKYAGRSLTLYCDPEVKWAGMAVGGIRISHMSHIDREHTMALTASKGSRKPFKVLPLVMTERKPAPEPDNALLDAGMSAAQKGEKDYDAWIKTLTSPQKKQLAESGSGADMRKIAKAADEAASTTTGPATGTDR